MVKIGLILHKIHNFNGILDIFPKSENWVSHIINFSAKDSQSCWSFGAGWMVQKERRIRGIPMSQNGKQQVWLENIKYIIFSWMVRHIFIYYFLSFHQHEQEPHSSFIFHQKTPLFFYSSPSICQWKPGDSTCLFFLPCWKDINNLEGGFLSLSANWLVKMP